MKNVIEKRIKITFSAVTFKPQVVLLQKYFQYKKFVSVRTVISCAKQTIVLLQKYAPTKFYKYMSFFSFVYLYQF